MTTAAQIIDDKGGPAAFAEKLNKTPGAVRVWKHRNQIPREAWPDILTVFPDVSLETLIATEPAPSGASA